jgi:signal transduction histidine kinase
MTVGAKERRQRWPFRGWPGGLSARLLGLTALFVMLAELMILAPSMAGFHENWLIVRTRLAEEASVAVELAPAGAIPQRKTAQLLEGAGVVTVAVSSRGLRRLLLAGPRMETAPTLIDLRHRNSFDRLTAPFETLAPGPPRMLRVVAKPQFRDGDFVEIVAPEGPLREDLTAYLGSILLSSVFISLVAGVLVYVSINAVLVRPMRRITRAMERFRARPEDPQARLRPSGRDDEIGRAEVELNQMQEDLLAALHSRARLAALGEAVAKINHDLRNMLTSAQFASERLAASGDPNVTQALPRLERALNRAVRLAEGVLTYGKSEEAAPTLQILDLVSVLNDAGEDAGLLADGETEAVSGAADGGVALEIDPTARRSIRADPDQLHRIFVNLFRNARQAIESRTSPVPAGLVRVTADAQDGVLRVRIADNGPGLPERARARLFQAFSGSQRPDGAGLGLAIARELAVGHGGDLVLLSSSEVGATFELSLPLPGPGEGAGGP